MRSLRKIAILFSMPMGFFPSALAQSQMKQNQPEQVPVFIKAEHVQASKGDAMAMIRENQKRQTAGLETRYDDNQIEQKLVAGAKSGNAKAMLALAKFRRERLEIATPESEAPIKDLLRKAATQEDPEAMAEWALWLSKEPERSRDPKEIEHWFYKAWDAYESKAKRGDVNAMMALASIPVPLTFPTIRIQGQRFLGDEMREWRQEAAKNGDPSAMFILAMEIYGRSPLTAAYGPESASEQWFLRSAKAGNWQAMLQLATIYGHGGFQHLDGGEPLSDPVKAWYWLDKAIEVTGNPRIGYVYFSGEEEGDFMEGFPPRPTPSK